MALCLEYTPGFSQFNEFLFAYVDEENKRLPPADIFALARLGVDAWEEAAALSAMAEEVA